jgi:hypothetical protein
MTIGFPVTKARIDGQLGDAVYALREALARVARLKLDLDEIQDADLQAMGYTAGEVTTLKASITDLNALANISHGQGTQAQPNDFFFNARQLIRLS